MIFNKLISPFGLVIILNIFAPFIANARNYIRTTMYCSNDSNLNNAKVNTRYFDGLGRERLVVSDNLGGNGNAVSLKTEYDTRGNVMKKWQPVPGGMELLESKTFTSKQASFYGSDEIPYTLYNYEENGLNRLISEKGPGALWKGHDREISRRPNEPSGKYSCKQFSFNRSNISTILVIPPEITKSTISIKGVYPPGALRIKCMTDEDGKEIIIFKDRLNRTILNRVVSSDDQQADTYFVYDNAGDLRYTLSPEGSALLPASGIVSTNILDKYAQSYSYDAQHRCITAKAPGCEAIHYVYDKLGRVIFESTATQRADGIWTLTKYDSQFRPAIKGVVSLPGKTRAALQLEYGNSLIIEDPDYNYNSFESKLGYPGSEGPTGFQPYISWMYDNYDFIVGPNEREKASFAINNEKYTQKGLCTGIITKKDLNNDVYVKALKYDHNGNLMRSCFWDLDLREFRLTNEYEYDFVGNLTTHSEKYESIVEASLITEEHQAVTQNTYDLQGRLLTSTLTIDNSAPVLLQNNKYDEIGRLKENSAGITTAYSYDIRSHLTEITSPVFSQKTWFGDTPDPGRDGSFIFANASQLNWGKNNTYSHIEEYVYDSFGRFNQMKANNNLIAEKMDADLNADVREIVRTYRGDIIQDATLGFDGCKLTSVHDVSTPYWQDAVASFPEGDYALEYDADGRLVKDETRDIASITYQPFGNLPNRMETSDGSYMSSTYFSDGTLKSRRMSARTIEIVTKVDANGDTIQTERTRNVTSTRSYCGNFEWAKNECVYHTSAGYYSVKDGQHYWYVRDRLGSTVAVTDKDGNMLQATGYYPSGTPYQIPDATLATEVDAKTDQLHIGNRWIGHKGLDLYDNTARMHDPLLARFHTVDPLFADYPSHSPWAHCAANPLNFIDPTGCASIIYDGKVIGNDGKDDGRVLLLPAFKKGYTEFFNKANQTLPAFSHGKDVTNKIVKFIKQNNGKTDAFNNATFENKNIYEYFFELESNPENIAKMNNEVSKDTGKYDDSSKDSNNREYGGYFSNGKIIIEKPGEVANPSQGGASIFLDQRKSSFHSHPSAIIDDGPTKSAYWQYPSITDITNKEHNGVNYVIGRRTNEIYFYNNQGIIGIMNYTNFLKLFNKK